MKKQTASAWFMILPMMLGITLFYLISLGLNTFYSFTDLGGFGRFTRITAENYLKLFSDPMIPKTLLTTFTYVFLTVIPGVFLSILAAVLMNSRIRGKNIFRTVYFLPIVTLPAAVAVIWLWIFNYQYGIINNFLTSAGFSRLKWLTDPFLFRLMISMSWVWGTIGYNMIIFLGGLQSIPETYYEASRIDGAGSTRQFFDITLPLLSPSIFFVTVTSIIGVFQSYEGLYILAKSNTSPMFKEIATTAYYYFSEGFIYDHKGYAAAIGTFLLAVIGLITAFQFHIQKKWVYYSGDRG